MIKTLNRLKLYISINEIFLIISVYIIYFLFFGMFYRNTIVIISGSHLQAFKNPMLVQFLLMPVYLFLLLKHDSYISSFICKTRFSSQAHAYLNRLIVLIIEVAVFVTPFSVLLIAITLLNSLSFMITVLYIANVYLSYFIVGAICCFISLKWHQLVYLIAFVFLTLDSFAAIGILPYQLSVFYLPYCSIFAESELLTVLSAVLVSFIKLIAIVCLTFIFFKKKMQQGKIHLLRPMIPYAIWAAALGVLLTVFAVSMRFSSVEMALIALLGGMYSGEIPSIIITALYNIVFLSQLYLFGAIMYRDLDRAAIYLFSRAYSRTKWYLRKCVEIFIYSMSFSIILAGSIITISLVTGLFSVDIKMLVTVIVSMSMTVWLGYFALILCTNLLSIKLNPGLAVLLIWIIYMPGQILIGFAKIYPGIIKFYPASQTILPLHTMPAYITEPWEDFFSNAINGFTPEFSFIYNTLLIIAVLMSGLLYINKRDITV